MITQLPKDRSFERFGVLVVCAALCLVSCNRAVTPPAASAVKASGPVLDALRSPSRALFWPAVHRGDSDLGLGNSARGIENAARAGATLIEIDVRMNREGVLFLFHDGKLRARNFSGPRIWYGKNPERLGAELLGSLCDPSAHICAPELAEALKVLKPYAAALLVDVKRASRAMLDGIVAEAQRSSQLSQIIIQCPALPVLRALRKRHPEVAVLARTFSPAQAREAIEYSPEIIQGDDRWLTEDLIKEIHRQGARVLVKTLDEESDTPAHWLRLRKKGVDIVLTDRFEEFMEIAGDY